MQNQYQKVYSKKNLFNIIPIFVVLNNYENLCLLLELLAVQVVEKQL
jgi:hypothetical protein